MAANRLKKITCIGLFISVIVPVVHMEAREIVLGKVSQKPLEKIKEYQPIADYLAVNLSDFDIHSGKVKVAPDTKIMAQWLASGEVDLFFDNAYSALLAGMPSGAKAIVFRVKTGSAKKSSVFFTRTESELRSLSDLKGKLLAVEEPESISGFLLPIAYLLEAGLNPTEKQRTHDSVGANDVGYIFSQDDDNTVQWIFNRRVAAGALDNEDFQEIAEETPGVFKVLAKTESVSRNQPGIVPVDMDPALIKALVALLLTLKDREEGQTIMEASETQQFTEMSEQGEAELSRIRAMHDLIHHR